jgi:hypothetical protein
MEFLSRYNSDTAVILTTNVSAQARFLATSMRIDLDIVHLTALFLKTTFWKLNQLGVY